MAQGDQKFRPRRCWWRMLKMIYVGDNFEILVTDLRCRFRVFILRKSPTWRAMSSTLWFSHRHLKPVTIIKSPTKPCHQHHWDQSFKSKLHFQFRNLIDLCLKFHVTRLVYTVHNIEKWWESHAFWGILYYLLYSKSSDGLVECFKSNNPLVNRSLSIERCVCENLQLLGLSECWIIIATAKWIHIEFSTINWNCLIIFTETSYQILLSMKSALIPVVDEISRNIRVQALLFRNPLKNLWTENLLGLVRWIARHKFMPKNSFSVS